ncbi:ATP/GTP-binding protein [Sporocytophaga myxococcoides]|uniref:ATP/GTP-binding protein n=1 Tax=Sporocytophaga myxococcoides TaxID=153721 RepID=A0A098LCB1_9BACT|nr:ATP/GTP-binding protein [Sporocytophaga myxococcoides]GAL84616.1 ATP/GTP-binding protein [Sporocytophaga myxococcoides]
MLNLRQLFLPFVLFVAASFTVNSRSGEPTLQKKWETEAVLKTPESVIFDAKRNVLYVANINGDGSVHDGNGFITKLGTDGKITELEWVKGLDAPKGMGIVENKLYVSDINKVVVIDILSGKIEKSFTIEGAVFLNDITTDISGNVYISDSSNKKIYLLKDGTTSLWLENNVFEKPNGLLALKDGLRVIDMKGGKFYNVSYDKKNTEVIAENIPSGDGIVEINKGAYLISNWNGEVNYIKGKTVSKLLDTKDEKINAADIWYVPQQKLVLVPTFFGNKLVAYTFIDK